MDTFFKRRITMWLDIQIFGFRALWSPLFLTFIICISIAYFLITGPMRDRFDKKLPAPIIRQQLYFYSSMLLIYLVKGAPVDLLSHIMMSAHMIQMAILYFIVPIFIIRGLLKWVRSEEHTSGLQSRRHLVCRLLLE